MSRNTFIEQSFHAICKDAKAPEAWFVCLIEKVPYYGGPEEGGWWGDDSACIAFKEYPTEESAAAAAAAVTKLAEELRDDSLRQYGEHCCRQLEWLDARGLDADFLPEDDGPTDYYVWVGDHVPEASRGCRHYE